MLRGLIVTPLFVAALSWPAHQAFAAKPTTLWAFNKSGNQDGMYPQSALIADKNGNLFGTTSEGGTHGAGIVFMLTPPGTAGTTWSETILYEFAGGQDGTGPAGGLALDASGNLYGVTRYGGGTGCGGGGCGTVFEIAPSGAETVLYRFTGSADGGVPYGAPLLRHGTVYGTTTIGGEVTATDCAGVGCGVVYTVAPAKGGWQETVLHAFGGQSANDGNGPYGGLIAGAGGVLYGTTGNGGVNSNGGTVFAMTPSGQGGWSESIAYTFVGTDILCPLATLSQDSAGALYGTGKCGGAADDGGIFRLMPPAKGQTDWSYATLYSTCSKANCDDGETPGFSGVTLLGDKLYGTANGGRLDHGVVFKLSPPGQGQSLWRESVLYTFPAAKGNGLTDPVYGVIARKNVLYGVVNAGGSPADNGAVYSLAP